MTPSIYVARRLAQVFGVTVDSLVSERELPDLLQDQTMIERWRSLDQVAEARLEYGSDRFMRRMPAASLSSPRCL
jgi:hypothetical protein